MKKKIIGVFNAGKLVFQIGMPFNGTEMQAELIVAILDGAKKSLGGGDYFAWDYERTTG